ncbi:SRPBCC family protein [Pseudonocardia sp. GCM10023141]|uniref:SRPBCC family protein n=1 Tax=Pseudonocardia sp. GCM10023141 TaxID=3252653 RepID=UPI003612D75A
MTGTGFTTTFTVDQTRAEAFAAVLDPRGWWAEGIDGRTDEVGAEFTYAFEDVHRTRIRVTDIEPDRKVSWLVLENHFNFTQDDTEWTGTTMTFDITEADGATTVRFTHEGLVPAYECFEACSTGWTFYVATSLRNLIATGTGQPNADGRPRLDTEVAAVEATGRRAAAHA